MQMLKFAVPSFGFMFLIVFSPLCATVFETGEDEDDAWGGICTYRSRACDCNARPHISRNEKVQAGSSMAARVLHVNCSSGDASYASKMVDFLATVESHKWYANSVIFDEDPTAELAHCKAGNINSIVCFPGVTRRLWLSSLPGDLVLPGIFACVLIQDIVRLFVNGNEPSRPNALGHWRIQRMLHHMEAQREYVELVRLAHREQPVVQHFFLAPFEDSYKNFKLMLAKHLMQVYQLLLESHVAHQSSPLSVLAQAIAGRFERMLSEIFMFQQNFGVSQCLVWDPLGRNTSGSHIRLRMDQTVTLEKVSSSGLYVGTCVARMRDELGSYPSLAYQYHDLFGPRWQILYALVQRLRTNSARPYINVFEIGVASGSTAEQLLRHCESVNYTGVDSYSFEDKNIANWINKSGMLHKLKQFPNRAQHVHAASVDAARDIQNASLDLVFIDANHSFDGALEDIETWISKVRSGGVLAGHDFNAQHTGVIAAVMTVAFKTRSVIHLAADAVWWFLIP